MSTKYIFTTGGVISSLGKGLTSASIGLILKRRGLNVKLQKFDPYINVDPGTMNPFQHGEVYVTEDGAETDLDLGHYERFTDTEATNDSNYTTGKIYSSVIKKEREGKYLGKTVQVVPHITNEIKDSIRKLAAPDIDVVISEIGGTVGDIESLPFLEAIRQFRYDEGEENVLYIHLTLVPYIHTAGEVKTKPTQHSVGRLREIGILPDVLICRSTVDLAEDVLDKIALFCNVKKSRVFVERDVDHSIYEVPILLHRQGLDQILIDHFGLSAGPCDLKDWEDIIEVIKKPKDTVKIAVVGKYISLVDAYKSIYEALHHGAIANGSAVDIIRIEAEDIAADGPEAHLQGVDGILVPGGFGQRGIDGKIEAFQFARENKIPVFGICLGLQCAVIELGRNVCNLENADTSERNSKTDHPVICLMEEQKEVVDMGATMRLGAWPCKLKENTHSLAAYKQESISERHRHRYEFNNNYRELFEENGITFAGLSPDGELVEIVEYKDHPWYVAVQFHPEFKSRPNKAHPLFKDFIKAALDNK